MTDPTRRPNPAAGKPAAARPAAAQPARAPQAAARPAQAAARAPAPAPAPAAAPPRRSPPPRRTGPADEPLDSTTKKGLIAAGIMVVIASVVWFVISAKQTERKNAEEAAAKVLSDFLKDMEQVDMKDKPALEAAIKRIDAEPAKWKDTANEAAISAKRSRFTGAIQEIDRIREFREAFDAAVKALENPASLSSEELIKIRQKLGDIEGQAEGIDPAYPAKIKAMKLSIDQIVVGKVREEAKAFSAASGTTTRQGLAKYAQAEDFIRKVLTDAKQSKSPDEPKYLDIYKGLVQESDEYALRVINEEFTNSIQWKDLLSGEMAGRWAKTSNIPGFSCRVENGVLTISPPDKGSGAQGVASIYDQPSDNLRHLALDMEFTVDGYVKMFFHVNPPPAPPDSRACEQFDLEAKDGAFVKDQKYNLVASYIGSQLTITFPNQDLSPWSETANPLKLRKGGIAFVIKEGARLRVTRMRIKELK